MYISNLDNLKRTILTFLPFKLFKSTLNMLKYIFLLILIRLAHKDYLVSKSPTIVKDHLLAPQELIHDFLLWWSPWNRLLPLTPFGSRSKTILILKESVYNCNNLCLRKHCIYYTSSPQARREEEKMCEKSYHTTPFSLHQLSGSKYQEILLGRAIHTVYLNDNSVRPDPYLTDTP